MNRSLTVGLVLAGAMLAGCRHAQPSPAAAAAATPTTSMVASRPFTDAQVAAGDSIFHTASCFRCHGPDASGTPNGPSLRGPSFGHTDGSYGGIIRVITNGVPAKEIVDLSHKLAMRPRGGAPILTDEQIRAVAAYVYTLSHR